MSTEALLLKTIHPPCTEEQEILEFTVPLDRTELTLTDRLSLRIGLWLMLRAERARPRTMTREEVMRLLETRRTTEREAMTMLTYDLQRQLR